MKGIRDLGEGVFRIDATGLTHPYPRYAYLVLEGERGALVDPGPLEDFPSTLAILRTVLPLERVSLIVLTGETPDACSSLLALRREGFDGIVLAHRRAEALALSYGEVPFKAIESGDESIALGGGRTLRLVNVPGIPTAGSLFCFDERSGSLFTGKLFGSVGAEGSAEDEETPGRLESFHDLVFPRLGDRADIGEILRSLKPLRALPRNGPPVESRLPFAVSMLAKADAGGRDLLSEVARLKAENLELQKSIIQASDDQLKDPVTGFYNEVFFEEYIDSLLPREEGSILPEDSVAFIRLDRIQRLNQRFGAKAGDSTLKGLGRLLLEHKPPEAIFFRMNGPLFACYLQGTDKAKAVAFAGELKGLVEDSDGFVDKITVSSAIVEFTEIGSDRVDSGRLHSGLLKVGKERLRLLDKLGPGSICADSEITLRRSSGTVLLIENNAFEADLLRRVLERHGFETHVVTRGSEALMQADLYRPEVIVSEIFIPQMDGFQIRQRLMASTDLRNVPFILISRDKSESSVQRAQSLGIRHFFRKPFLAGELAGIIKLLISDPAAERRP
jgi:diguanylate cyclase (GGDEF)-like protein